MVSKYAFLFPERKNVIVSAIRLTNIQSQAHEISCGTIYVSKQVLYHNSGIIEQ